jgi:hypothetical protein
VDQRANSEKCVNYKYLVERYHTVVPYLQMNIRKLQMENRDSKRQNQVFIDHKGKIST